MPELNVEMGVLVTVNGRPIWRKVKKISAKGAGQLTDEGYDRVLGTAERELVRLLELVRSGESPRVESDKKSK